MANCFCICLSSFLKLPHLLLSSHDYVAFSMCKTLDFLQFHSSHDSHLMFGNVEASFTVSFFFSCCQAVGLVVHTLKVWGKEYIPSLHSLSRPLRRVINFQCMDPFTSLHNPLKDQFDYHLGPKLT